MAGGTSVHVLRDINTLFEAGTVSGLSDRLLLERFSTGRDVAAEAAFEAIVQRHGPMVLRLCFKLLGNQADAEEAFQATFLILVKKYRSIRKLDTVGGWLFGVASRVAARAGVERARRRSAEEQGGLRIAMATAATTDGGADSGDGRELGAAVEAEVLRLPEKYRAVVVLCYWEGLTHEQAALRLGCPLGTVRSRMARARKLLERRLSRRGLQPVAGVMAAALDSPAMMSTRALEIPPALMSSTVKLATQVATGGSLTKLTSPAIAALVQNVIGGMLMSKLKTIAVCVLLICAGAYGLALAAQAERGREKTAETGQPVTVTKSKAQPPLKLMSEYVVEPPDVLVVEVMETLPGRPSVEGEHLVRPDGTIGLGVYGEINVAGLTLSEVKKKVIGHMQKFLKDEALGLVVLDEETGDIVRDPKTGEPERIDPKHSNLVFVDVTAYNSKNYYVQGAVPSPGRIPITGRERVLDAISFCNGLTPEADHEQVFLYREGAEGEPAQTLKVDIDQIMLGDDLSTNYQLLPGDKLVVRPKHGLTDEKKDMAARQSAALPKAIGESSQTRRTPNAVADKPAESPRKQRVGSPEPTTVQRLEKRISELERQLDLILETLKRPAR